MEAAAGKKEMLLQRHNIKKGKSVGVSVNVAMIERIVRSVVEQLPSFALEEKAPQSVGRERNHEAARLPSISPSLVPGPESLPEGLSARPGKRLRKRLGRRILTVRDVELLGDSVRELAVLPETVVTPAAHDALSERQVRLSRQSELGGQEGDLIVYACQTRISPQSLLGIWSRVGIRPELGAAGLDWKTLRSLLKQERWSVVLTEEVEEGLCLLNRSESVRAVSVRSVSRLGEVVRRMDPNVLVLNPLEIGIYQAGQIVIQAVAGAVA